MNFDTIQLSHIWDESTIAGLNDFLSRTAFVISHKSEPIEELVGVLWHLPVHTPILVVSNCPVPILEELQYALPQRLPRHRKLYLIHQKDLPIARFLGERGVSQILGEDQRVLSGKGEGMYLGALGVLLLGYPEWVVFFDADNLLPAALLEYALAMSRLFLAEERPVFHNVRIFWASKPRWKEGNDLSERVLGRCSSVVSPVIDALLQDRFGLNNSRMMVSNAGEQGLNIAAARALRFSSGYSVETFQLLDLLAMDANRPSSSVLLQQYEARALHFHEKGDEEHIKQMIAQSLGCFYFFEEQLLTERGRHQIEGLMKDQELLVTLPRVYPALETLHVEPDEVFMERYRLPQVQAKRAAGREKDEACAS